MTQRVILFNGPPRSGKDTAAKALFEFKNKIGTKLEDKLPYLVFDRMSMPIKKAFAGTIAKPIDKWGNVEYWEDHKSEFTADFGVSYRQWQIDFSEKFMKPLYGERVFGNLFITRAERQHKDAVFLVPDCGFDIEYSTLTPYFGPENVLVVKIYRPGCDFSSDSRTYLSVGSNFLVGDAGNVRHVHNSGTQDEFETKILTLVKEWLS